MRSYQANRLWMIDGSSDYQKNIEWRMRLKALGLENVTVRYHENTGGMEARALLSEPKQLPEEG